MGVWEYGSMGVWDMGVWTVRIMCRLVAKSFLAFLAFLTLAGTNLGRERVNPRNTKRRVLCVVRPFLVLPTPLSPCRTLRPFEVSRTDDRRPLGISLAFPRDTEGQAAEKKV
jgi:hypothetical protein